MHLGNASYTPACGWHRTVRKTITNDAAGRARAD